MNDQITMMAMDILMHAGDARSYCLKYLECVMNGDEQGAEENLKKAEEENTLSHKTQTDAIQKAVAGEEFAYSLLLTHAQDWMMTVESEIILAKQMAAMYRKMNERITKLEEK